MTRYKLRKIGANTMVGYRSYLTNHLYPNFGDLPIDSITVDRVQDFMLLEADNGTAKASINRIMQLLTQIMDSAVEDELIIKNPCKSKRLYNPSEKQCKVLPYSPGVYKQMERLLSLLPTDTDKLYFPCAFVDLKSRQRLTRLFRRINLIHIGVLFEQLRDLSIAQFAHLAPD